MLHAAQAITMYWHPCLQIPASPKEPKHSLFQNLNKYNRKNTKCQGHCSVPIPLFLLKPTLQPGLQRRQLY